MIDVFKKVEEKVSFSRNLESIFLKSNRKYRRVTTIKNSIDILIETRNSREKGLKN